MSRQTRMLSGTGMFRMMIFQLLKTEKTLGEGAEAESFY